MKPFLFFILLTGILIATILTIPDISYSAATGSRITGKDIKPAETIHNSDGSTTQVYRDKNGAGSITGQEHYSHMSCSNHKDSQCWGQCEAERLEREPREKTPKPPVPTPTTTPAPPFGQTTTTTPSEIRCSTTNDCNINFVCCQNACHEESKGICRDINGDGIPDWLTYVG